MFDLIATVLAWFYDLTHSYGAAIALLTLAIMVVLTPLTLKGTRSMMVMQALQPEMRKIQQRYKDDRQKLNEELLLFYKENKINPLGGCLPLLIQMPVFLVLYKVLQGLTNPSKFGVVLERLTGGAITPGFDPSYIGAKTELHQALAGSSDMVSWGIDLSRSATQAIRDSFGSALPYLVLVIAVAATSYYQQRQVQGRNPNAGQINPQQQMLMRILPLFFAFISINLPAALVLYFLVSNLYRVAQQAFISHRIYKPAVASGMFDTTATDAAAKDSPASKPSATATKGTSAKPVSRSTAQASTVAVDEDAARPATGFFARLLGDAAPRLGSASKGNGAGAPETSTAAKPPVRGNPAPAAKAAGGRTTQAGVPQPRARKKKKRK